MLQPQSLLQSAKQEEPLFLCFGTMGTPATVCSWKSSNLFVLPDKSTKPMFHLPNPLVPFLCPKKVPPIQIHGAVQTGNENFLPFITLSSFVSPLVHLVSKGEPLLIVVDIKEVGIQERLNNARNYRDRLEILLSEISVDPIGDV